MGTATKAVVLPSYSNTITPLLVTAAVGDRATHKLGQTTTKSVSCLILGQSHNCEWVSWCLHQLGACCRGPDIYSIQFNSIIINVHHATWWH